jgi:hypothetical protein
MGAARKLVEGVKDLVRAIGLYRRKTGEQIREEGREQGKKWWGKFEVDWTWDIHRICDGRVQVGLLLRIFAHTVAVPVRDGKEPARWTPGMNDEDWAKELDVARNTVRDAIDGAVARGLIARMSEDPKAKARAYYRLRLTPENWKDIADPITPKKQPARAETAENQDKRPAGDGQLHRVRPGHAEQLVKGHRYEFDVAPTVFENYLDAPGRLVMNAAGLLRLDPALAKAEVVEMPASNGSATENKGAKPASRSGGLKRNGKLNLADIPLTVAAMKASGFHYAANLLPELFRRTRDAVVGTGAEEELVGDRIVSWAIVACQAPKQRSAALFWDTVPAWVASHLHDKAPPSREEPRGRKSQNEEYIDQILKGTF